jgi:hypothetical protein
LGILYTSADLPSLYDCKFVEELDRVHTRPPEGAARSVKQVLEEAGETWLGEVWTFESEFKEGEGSRRQAFLGIYSLLG